MIKFFKKDDINTVPFVVTRRWNLMSASDVYLLYEEGSCPNISLSLVPCNTCDNFTFTLLPIYECLSLEILLS
jgi:hypothetical protein